MRIDRPKCGPNGVPIGVAPFIMEPGKAGLGVGFPMTPDAMRVLAYLLNQMADGMDGKVVSVEADHYVINDELTSDS